MPDAGGYDRPPPPAGEGDRDDVAGNPQPPLVRQDAGQGGLTASGGRNQYDAPPVADNYGKLTLGRPPLVRQDAVRGGLTASGGRNQYDAPPAADDYGKLTIGRPPLVRQDAVRGLTASGGRNQYDAPPAADDYGTLPLGRPPLVRQDAVRGLTASGSRNQYDAPPAADDYGTLTIGRPPIVRQDAARGGLVAYGAQGTDGGVILPPPPVPSRDGRPPLNNGYQPLPADAATGGDGYQPLPANAGGDGYQPLPANAGGDGYQPLSTGQITPAAMAISHCGHWRPKAFGLFTATRRMSGNIGQSTRMPVRRCPTIQIMARSM